MLASFSLNLRLDLARISPGKYLALTNDTNELSQFKKFKFVSFSVNRLLQFRLLLFRLDLVCTKVCAPLATVED